MITSVLQNVFVAVVVAGVLFALRAAGRRDDWRNAWRQLKVNRLAMLSLCVIGLYASIGLLDSVVWRAPVTDESGAPILNSARGVIYEAKPTSLLDRALAFMKRRNERTYSAPLASRLFVKETVETQDGKSERMRPELHFPHEHLLGTDKVGDDVFFRALKGVRTALIVGGLSTLLIIPLAVFFGITAGYFGGRIDDAVQYTYTVLASIPFPLIILSFMMLAGQGLLPMCIILAVTSWTGLCRLLRAETLKIRELEYIQAARALGIGHIRIMLRHILPNVTHIILITFVLRFSDLIFAEAFLSYLGFGVEPGTGSWGHMVNAARLELSRDPVIWWNLLGAFAFMFGLVLPMNLFGDALRDALDPKLRTK